MSKSKVYFTSDTSPDSLIKLYKAANIQLPGKIAVKVHSGERGNTNFIKPSFFKPIIDYVKGTPCETLTIANDRETLEEHIKILKEHEWSTYFPSFDILDSEEPDIEEPVPKPFRISKNYLSNHLKNYDSLLILSHFKGHIVGGFGGAMKNVSIGLASNRGKCYIHTNGKTFEHLEAFNNISYDKDTKEAMADAAYTVVNRYKNKILFINCMINLSEKCDCHPCPVEPCMKDIGILCSEDPVAIDKACVDLIYNSDDKGKEKIIHNIESKFGKHVLECAQINGTGSMDYELIYI